MNQSNGISGKGIACFVLFLVVVFGIYIAISASQKTSVQSNLDAAMSALKQSVSDTSRAQINEGIKKGSAQATYDYAKRRYNGDPLQMLVYLSEAYIEDGVIDDYEKAYLDQVSKAVQQALESIATTTP